MALQLNQPVFAGTHSLGGHGGHLGNKCSFVLEFQPFCGSIGYCFFRLPPTPVASRLFDEPCAFNSCPCPFLRGHFFVGCAHHLPPSKMVQKWRVQHFGYVAAATNLWNQHYLHSGNLFFFPLGLLSTLPFPLVLCDTSLTSFRSTRAQISSLLRFVVFSTRRRDPKVTFHHVHMLSFSAVRITQMLIEGRVVQICYIYFLSHIDRQSTVKWT